MDRLSIKDLQTGYKNKEFSPVEVTRQYLKRISSLDKIYNSYITVSEEEALKIAEVLEKKMLTNECLGNLFGIPISYKDNIYTKGIRTTNGSAIDKNFIPQYNAQVVNQLLFNDSITLGKTNLHEYCLGITSNNPHYGPVRNPWNTKLTPGGSSGGAGAAVAANLCMVGIGTDTGGSVRIPAASTGVIGLKPTHDLISKKGVTQLSWSLDHVGPLTSNMEDLAIVMEAMTKKPFTSYCIDDIRGIRVGIPTNYFNEKVDNEIYEIYKRSFAQLEKLGCVVIELDIPFINNNTEIGKVLSLGEVAFLFEERMKEGMGRFGNDVKDYLKSTDTLSAIEYIKAQEKQKKLSYSVNELFEKVDILLTPTLPTTPKEIGVEEIYFDGVPEDIFRAY